MWIGVSARRGTACQSSCTSDSQHVWKLFNLGYNFLVSPTLNSGDGIVLYRCLCAMVEVLGICCAMMQFDSTLTVEEPLPA